MERKKPMHAHEEHANTTHKDIIFNHLHHSDFLLTADIVSSVTAVLVSKQEEEILMKVKENTQVKLDNRQKQKHGFIIRQ